MDLLDYLKDKLSASEWDEAHKIYREETKVFMETLERLRANFKEEMGRLKKEINLLELEQ